MATSRCQSVDLRCDWFAAGDAADPLGDTHLDAAKREVYRALVGVDAPAYVLPTGRVDGRWASDVADGVFMPRKAPDVVGGQLAGVLGGAHKLLR